MILEEIAQTVAENTAEIIGHPISITNEKGYIIGSTDRSRLGTFHMASIEVLTKNDTVSYGFEDVKSLENVLPGVASPIIFDRKAIGVLGIIGNPQEVKKYVQLVKSHVELLCQESFKKEMTVLETKAIDSLIHYLIHVDAKTDIEHILRYGAMLGYNLEGNRVCLLIEINMLSLHSSESLREPYDKFSLQFYQREVIDTVKLIFQDSKQDIISLLNPEQFIIVKSLDRNESTESFMKSIERKTAQLNAYVQRKYKLNAAVAVGDVKKGVSGLAESYQNASKALAAGKRTNLEPRLYRYNDLHIMLELLTWEVSPSIRKGLSDLVSALLHSDNFAILAQTFLTYCKCNMNVSETARSLFIHRNTLVYRLERIRELTRLDVTNFEHCLLIYITIKNYQQQMMLRAHEKKSR
jgi:carbohydrate diacid regulator